MAVLLSKESKEQRSTRDHTTFPPDQVQGMRQEKFRPQINQDNMSVGGT